MNMGVMSIDLNAVVQRSIGVLRAQLGKQWLSNRMFGVRLHAVVAEEIEKIHPLRGWIIAVEKPIRLLPFANRALLDMTVEDYLKGPGAALHMYRQELRAATNMAGKVGDLKPDLAIRRPDGVIVVWDLTSRQSEHLVKTMLYANVLSSFGQLVKIGEDYWAMKAPG
jgi:hypothetical protein